MNTNVLNAIMNLIDNPIFELRTFYQSKNRANNMGEALEQYIKDLFANTINSTEEERILTYNDKFSYLGNQNNPPDIIIRNGDAIEVKKIESKNSDLALNSSYPKEKLYANSSMITQECRNCEEWSQKDILYTIGVVKANNLESLCFVYGEDYAASAEIYEKVKEAISLGILTIPDIEFAKTNELGRVNRVDPLGITNLRIRGMWTIQNPLKVFNYVYNEKSKNFNFMAIINKEKYHLFENKNKFEAFAVKNSNVTIKDIYIKSPNNPAKIREAKLITFSL